MVIAAWIILVLAIVIVLRNRFVGPDGFLFLLILLIMIFLSATIIFEDVHSFDQLRKTLW